MSLFLRTALPIWQAARLLRRPGAGLSKRDVLSAHARLEALHVRRDLRASARGGTVDLLGYTIRFPDVELLKVLFEEIFINEDYYFESGREAPFILDAGSNIGTSILYFKKLYPRSRIIGFEALPRTFGYLRTNIEINDLEDVDVHNRALADKPGESTLYFEPDLEGSLTVTTVACRSSDRHCTVENALLSEYITEPVDLLKLDIEGAETAVLRELVASGKLPMIRTIILEYHHHIDPGEDALSTVLQWLEEAGFGYLLEGSFKVPPRLDQMQPLRVYAYNKAPIPD